MKSGSDQLEPQNNQFLIRIWFKIDEIWVRYGLVFFQNGLFWRKRESAYRLPLSRLPPLQRLHQEAPRKTKHGPEASREGSEMALNGAYLALKMESESDFFLSKSWVCIGFW